MFSRLKQLFRRGTARETPKEDPVDARSRMFPEYGLRTESEKLSASFDPFNFATRTARAADTAAEAALIREGRLDGAKGLVAGKIASLPASSRMEYVLRVTSEAHELRHYHDHFATTFGFSRVVATIADGIEFNRLWDELKGLKRIRLPLLGWARMDDAPPALKAYAATRRDYVENFVLNDGAVKTTVNFLKAEDATRAPTDAIAVISVGGITASIPMVDVNLQNARTGGIIQRLTPLGGNLLMEGNAFVIQRDLTNRLFGRDYEKELKRALMSGPMGDDYWTRYMAIDLFMSKRVGQHNVKFQLALSDVAMMAPVEGDLALEDRHPGWRFFKAINVAARDRAALDVPAPELGAYMAKLTSECKWPSLDDVTKQAIAKWEKALRDVEKRVGARPSFWDHILRAVIALHLKWLRIRERFPETFVEPELYFTAARASPLAPPVYVDNDGIWFQGEKGTEDGRALRQWFLFEHFQRQLLFSNELPCPATSFVRHDCPGDAIRTREWSPTGECAFSQLVDQLGVRGIEEWTFDPAS